MTLCTEENFKILAILFLIVPPILIAASFAINCDDKGQCNHPIQHLVPELTNNVMSITGAYLVASLFGIMISITAMITGTFLSSAMTIIGVIPWLAIILIKIYTKNFSKWKILYGWIIITQISYITFWIFPFPMSPF